MKSFLLIALLAAASCHLVIINGVETDLSENISLAPGVAQSFTNPFFFSVSISCTVSTPDSSDVIDIDLNGSGSVNGVSESGNFDYTVENGQTFEISAGASASVSLTNKGKSTVTADCDLSL